MARSNNCVGSEDLFDRLIEDGGDTKGERQARIVLSLLDGIDGLTGDLELLRQVCLSPIAFCPKLRTFNLFFTRSAFGPPTARSDRRTPWRWTHR